ncbi:MAG: hypothetical protein RBG1_1C00001G1111 [candidate division Zixibacteria bacterium RBG-1]|nr:MAG: hypothetical protein RBG1_1C00001G1111 [candidate division Zixibacteria bacterium RBG-1]
MHKKLTFLLVLLFASSTAFAQSNTTFSWDGELRGQYHYWGNEDLDTASDDFLNYKTLRTRLGVKAEIMENTSVYIQIQDSRYAGQEGSVYNGFGNLDLHQAYIMLDKLWDSPFSLKAGRQELSYGDGRLIGADDWAYTGTAFDAAKLMFRQGRVSMDLFTGQLTPFWGRYSGSLTNETFSGLYSSVNYLEHGMWDVYLLSYYHGEVAIDAPYENPAGTIANNTWLFTIGTRTSGTLVDDNFSYHGEFAYQFGDWLSSSVSAWAFSAGAGYEFPVEVAPYFGLEFNYASGDDSIDDGNRGTFTNLFPANHGKYGAMDQMAWQNMINVRATAGFKPVEKLDFRGDFHLFWLAQENDAWYTSMGFPTYFPDRPNFPVKGNLFGPVFVRGAAGTANNVGNELDLLLKYQYNDAVSWHLGFSHFFAGAVADSVLGTDAGDANWFYAQMKVGF